MHRGLKLLNNFEKKIFQIVKRNPKIVKIKQLGFSAPSSHAWQFHIYHREIGLEKNLNTHPVVLLAGVHGLELIGIEILLDFIKYILQPESEGFIADWKKMNIGLHVIPILNPGGVALRRRSNPSDVDLMRNAPVATEKPLFFFGGQSLSAKLPYYRGLTPEPENKLLFQFVESKLFPINNAILPVLDIHSGYGTVNSVWWPYAKSKSLCRDNDLFQAIAYFLQTEKQLTDYIYEPQSTRYTTHGDL